MDAPGSAEIVRPRQLWRLPDALPNLTGRTFVLVRLIWVAIFLLALVAPVAGLYLNAEADRTEFGPFRELGLRSTTSDGTRLGQPFGEEAKRQGVVRDAALVAIAGRQVPRGATRRDIAELLSSAPGQSVELITRTPDGEIRKHLLTRDPQLWAKNFRGSGISRPQRQWIARILAVLTAATAIGAAVLLAIRRPRDPVASMFSVGLLAQAASAGAAVIFWASLALINIGAILFFTSVVLFSVGVLVFPHGRFEPRWTKLIVIPLLLWMAFRVVEQFAKLIDPRIENSISILFFLVCLSGLLTRFRRLESGAERQQIRWALFGFTGFIISGVALVTLQATLSQSENEKVLVWSSLADVSLNALLTLFLAGGLLISLLRYRLYDAEAAISRSAGYAVLTIMLGGVFAASAKGLEWTFERNFGGDAGALPGAIGAGLAVVMITPLHNRVHRWAERRFHKQLIKLRTDLPLLVGDLRETSGLQSISGAVLESVMAGVRSCRTALVIADKLADARGIPADDVEAWRARWTPSLGYGLECRRDDAVFPIRVPLEAEGHGRVGWLLVGPRPDGTLIGKDEREVLAVVAEPVARAVQVALLREEREARHEARFRKLERRIAQLGKARPGPATA